MRKIYREILSGIIMLITLIFTTYIVAFFTLRDLSVFPFLVIFLPLSGPTIILMLIANYFIEKRRPIKSFISHLGRFTYLSPIIFLSTFFLTMGIFGIITRGWGVLAMMPNKFFAMTVPSTIPCALSGAIVGGVYWAINLLIERLIQNRHILLDANHE
jgi:hypothetical protein